MTVRRRKPVVRVKMDVLRVLMDIRGWTWPRLAEHAGMDPSSANRIRHDRQGVGAPTIAQLLAAFPEVKFENLFEVEGAIAPSPADTDDRDADDGSAA